MPLERRSVPDPGYSDHWPRGSRYRLRLPELGARRARLHLERFQGRRQGQLEAGARYLRDHLRFPCDHVCMLSLLRGNGAAERGLHGPADAGDADSQNIIGNIYSNGEYVEQDYKKAFDYYQKAAVQGHLWGMYNLSGCYVSGQGTDLDLLKAGEWLRKAAEGGLQEAIDTLNENPQFKDDFQVEEKQLTEEEARALYDAATKMTHPAKLNELRLAAEAGDVWGMFFYALLYDISNSVTRNYELAVEYYAKAANAGNALAMCNLGNCYYNGNGVNQDYAEAIKWYKKAAEAGYAYGLSGLALCYQLGNGVNIDYEKALTLYQQSLDKGREEDEWIIERMKECKILPCPNATIEKVWVDCDGVKEIYVHCNWIVNNLKGGHAQLKLTLISKFRKKLKIIHKEYSLGQYDTIECDSKRWENSVIKIDDFDLNLHHDEEETFGFIIELWELGDMCIPKKLLFKSKKMSFTTWNYFNFISKNKLEIRWQQTL